MSKEICNEKDLKVCFQLCFNNKCPLGLMDDDDEYIGTCILNLCDEQMK